MKKFVVLISILLFSSVLFSDPVSIETAKKVAENWYFERGNLEGPWTVWNTSNSNIPNNHIKALAIDSSGNVWTGHELGQNPTDARMGILHVSSGVWTIYTPSNSGLVGQGVDAFGVEDSFHHLARDDSGYRWIGTDNHHDDNTDDPCCTKFHGGGSIWSTYNPPIMGQEDDVSDIIIDTEENVWLATDGLDDTGGIAKFHIPTATWTNYHTGNSNLPHNEGKALAVELNGDIWVGTEAGLAKFEGGSTFTVYNTSNSGLPNDSVRAIAIDGHELWIGTMGGLAKFTPTIDPNIDWRVYNTSNSELPDNCVSDIIIYGGCIWAATSEGGIAKFELPNNWEVWNTTNSNFPCNVVTELAGDPERGGVWAGTWGGGLAFLPYGPSGIEERLKKAIPKTLKLTITPSVSSRDFSIKYDIPMGATLAVAQLKVYDESGRLVKVIFDARQRAGSYSTKWDGKDDKGIVVSSGVYFVKFTAGKFSQVRKLCKFKEK